MTPVNKIKLARTLYEESQDEFGQRIGYTTSWVSLMESGKKPIPKVLDDLLDYMIEEKQNEDKK